MNSVKDSDFVLYNGTIVFNIQDLLWAFSVLYSTFVIGRWVRIATNSYIAWHRTPCSLGDPRIRNDVTKLRHPRHVPLFSLFHLSAN